MIDKMFSHYRVVGRLGQGGMGVVYKALDTSLDRNVALKVLPEESLADETSKARLIREAKAGARLAHAGHDVVLVGRASLAEVIAIDYSGSMGMMVSGQTKLALANEAAARSASLLGSGDRLGVEHVDTAAAWTVPLGPVTDTNAIAAKIRSVQVGGGGIYTDLALREGYAALEKFEARVVPSAIAPRMDMTTASPTTKVSE